MWNQSQKIFHRNVLRRVHLAIGVFSGVFCLTMMAPLKADDSFLFVWAADADGEQSDFLAVIDANPQSSKYGDVLATEEVGLASGAHHTEHRMPQDGQLFMNGFVSGESFIMDLSAPLKPTKVGQFSAVGSFSHAHSFERLPNGNVIATFQNGPNGERITGGLVELHPSGKPVRWAAAANSGFPEIRPYSLTVVPGKDLIVTTTTDMWDEVTADSVQFWRMSDLTLQKTIQLPGGPRGDENEYPAEPRLMSDGETFLVNTFNCGLYQIHEFSTDEPRVEHLYTFEFDYEGYCALPAVVGKFWVQTVPARNGLVTLDLSDPSNPKEVSYLNFGPGRLPHWLAIDSSNERIVVTGHGAMLNSVIMVNFNTSNGSLSFDKKFGVDGVVNFGRTDWPHGPNGAAIPHGSVFSLP